MWTEAISFFQFLGGTDYTKSFKEETNEPNCTKIGATEHTMYDELGRTKSSEITFSYKCTEADPWWGILSASFIFVPGKLHSKIQKTNHCEFLEY